MKFNDLKKIMDDNFGTSLLADIAKEFEVTPQVVSNWKSRNQVPYKYIKIIREKIKEKNNFSTSNLDDFHGQYNVNQNASNNDSYNELLKMVLTYFEIIWRKKTLVILFVLLCFSIQFYLLKYHTVPIYISKATILPSKITNEGVSKLKSFASQFGFGSANQNAIDLSSSMMYPDIFSSKRLAKELLFKKFETLKYGKKMPLISIVNGFDYDINNVSEKTKNSAARKIQKMIKVRTNRESPLLKISISAFEAQFSADLLNGVLVEFKTLLKNIRLSKVIEKKSFILKRLEMVQKELDESENELKLFREKNRKIDSSPALILHEERLVRIVEVKTQIYINLSNQYETAQIEEVGGSSILEVLDAPETPRFKSGPNTFRSLIFSILLGFSTISGFFIIKENIYPSFKLRLESYTKW
jgi:uncharacterized protein involved in exopolysaccharide biosynthesis